MISQEFCENLEYKLSKAFEYSNSQQVKGYWCDGVLIDQPTKHYSIESINAYKQVKLKAFIGKDGQGEYKMILKFGAISLLRYSENLDISDCIPSPENFNWIVIDTNHRKIEIQLN